MTNLPLSRRLLAWSIASVLSFAASCASKGPSDAPDAGAREDVNAAAASAFDGGEDSGGIEPVKACARETLRGLVDHYFDALAAHDPMLLPVAPGVKFTENAQRLELGEGLWQKAGVARWKRSALDSERCGTHTQAVLEEDGVAVIFGVRLQLEDGLLSEIETYITRRGEYVVLGGLTVFDPENLAASDSVDFTDVKWEGLVPEAERSTRAQLNEIADLYFESFGPAGIVAPIQHDCYRWENGMQTTFGDCTLFLPAPGQGQGGLTHRRYPIADVEAGIAVGYVLFRDAIDFHMFKVIDGEVRLIQAVISAPGHSATGWEELER